MKCYIILLEDKKYTTNYLIHRLIRELNKKFYNDEIDRRKWIENQSKIEIRMIYKMKYLLLFEEYCINKGIYFRWIEDFGILVEPTLNKDISIVLNDTLYFKQYENKLLF